MERSRFFLLAACIAVLAAGCVAFDGGTPAVDEGELTAIEKTRGHPIYWAGRSIEGYPLTHAEALGSGKYLFIYGDCEIDDQGWFDDGGCTPPVDIQQYPIRARHPGMFDVDVGCRRLVVRRVPAAIFQSSGGALEIYTGASVVVIFGETGHSSAGSHKHSVRSTPPKSFATRYPRRRLTSRALSVAARRSTNGSGAGGTRAAPRPTATSTGHQPLTRIGSCPHSTVPVTSHRRRGFSIL